MHSQREELLVLLGVSCAERIGNYLRLSQRIGNGRRPVRRLLRFAVSWNVLRVRAQRAKKKFAFSLLRRTADFRPPVTPCQQIFALRYENLFCAPLLSVSQLVGIPRGMSVRRVRRVCQKFISYS